MGQHQRSPRELMLELQRELGIRCFVETGTFRGDTTAWASDNFEQVVTVEASNELALAAKERFASTANVDVVHGDTRTVLPGVLARLSGTAIVWDDSHWCAVPSTYGSERECPLIDEIATFRSCAHELFLFIDDARFFLSAPPLPHRIEDWPSISEVIHALTTGPQPLYVTVFDDVIIAVPDRGRDIVLRFCQRANTESLAQSEGTKERGARLLREGLSTLTEFYGRRLTRLASRLRR